MQYDVLKPGTYPSWITETGLITSAHLDKHDEARPPCRNWYTRYIMLYLCRHKRDPS